MLGPNCRDVAADVGERRDAQPEEFAVHVERELGMGDMVAALRV